MAGFSYTPSYVHPLSLPSRTTAAPTRTAASGSVSSTLAGHLLAQSPAFQAQPGYDPHAPAPNPNGFVPFAPATTAPPGSYDPAYDASLDNANQGFGWAAQDYGTQIGRSRGDYAQANEHLAQDRGSALANLLAARTRGQADYNTNVNTLNRNYSNLAEHQQGQERAAGVGEGGALAQAMMKRQANQGLAQTGLNTGLSRFLADNTTRTDQTNQAFDRRQGALDTGFLRENTDRNANFERAGLTNDAFNRQTNTEKLYIASQNGALPTPPANEHTANGQTFRLEVHNGVRWERLPNGQLVRAAKPTVPHNAAYKAAAAKHQGTA